MNTTCELQLYPTQEQALALTATMRAMNAASTEAARTGFANRQFSQVGIHHLVYRSLRENFGLPAQMAVRAIGKAVSVFARDRRKAPHFRLLGAVIYDARMLSHRPSPCVVSLLTLNGRVKIPYRTADRNRKPLAGKWGEAKLVLRGERFFLQVAVDVKAESPLVPTAVVGVDLGIRQIATLSTGQSFSGEAVQKARQRYSALRAGLQRKQTRSARRKFRKVSGREKRFVRNTNHAISRRIVDTAKALRAGLVLEDLTGLQRSQRSGSKLVRSLVNSWSFSQLRQFITYKAELAGVPVMVVDPAYTSQTCSACGHCEAANRKRSVFQCKACGHRADADVNASRNLALRGDNLARKGEGADVNRPIARA